MQYTFKWNNFNSSYETNLIGLSKNFQPENLKTSSVTIDPSNKIATWSIQFSEEQPKIQEAVLTYLDAQKILRPDELIVGDEIIQIPPKPGLLQTIWSFFYGQ